jgi:hypothetical protein
VCVLLHVGTRRPSTYAHATRRITRNRCPPTVETNQEFVDIVETVYRGARKGRGLVVSPKDYSTKYRY